MLYKTIMLEWLKDRPTLHERLRQKRKLLAVMESLAAELKTRHEYWKDRLSQVRPGSEPAQLASEALEISLKEMEELLPSESADTSGQPSLDAAMAFIHRHTPTA